MQTHQPQGIEEYIQKQRSAGASDEVIFNKLVQHGWDQNEVRRLLTDDVPAPPAPQQFHGHAQTGNTGTPVQVENVQYNMNIKPVESKIGLYMRLMMLGLWISVFAICILLSQIASKVANPDTTDMGATIVGVFSVLAVSAPVFWIANMKRQAAMLKDPRLVEDLFFKSRVRKSLRFAVVLTAIAGFIFVFNFLSMLFLQNSSSTADTVFAALFFAAGFGGILAFTWRLHAMTQR
jgi:hypothetical protein